VIFASNWATFCGTGCGVASTIQDYVVGGQPPPVVADTIPPAAVRDLRVQ